MQHQDQAVGHGAVAGPTGKPHDVQRTPPQDMYFKGALFLNTLRSVINDDAKWWKMLRDFFQTFKYRNIMTEDVVAFFNKASGRDLTPIFDQYLRHADLPTLELRFHPTAGTVDYRWKADEPRFAMPVRVGAKDLLQVIQPTTTWQTMKTTLTRETMEVATDLYFVNVNKTAGDSAGAAPSATRDRP
jgi:aminopeptidase N